MSCDATRVGPQGPPGINWRGDYDASARYKPGDGVYFEGSSWRCIKACLGEAPPDAEFWSPIALGGESLPSNIPQTLRLIGLCS